jgi:hypothetical protein
MEVPYARDYNIVFLETVGVVNKDTTDVMYGR